MKNWKDLKRELLQDKRVAVEYQKLGPMYDLISQLIEVRIKKGLSQAEVARKMKTKQSAISRLESGNANPSLGFLEKLSEAMGVRLRIMVQ